MYHLLFFFINISLTSFHVGVCKKLCLKNFLLSTYRSVVFCLFRMCTMYTVKIFALQWQFKVHSPSTNCHDIISHFFHNCLLCYGMRFKKYAMRLSAMIWYLYAMLWQIDTKGSMMCYGICVRKGSHSWNIASCIIYLIIHQ